MTVTRRHHPLLGQRLEVACGGPTQVVLRLRDGTSMRVPRAWTDADGVLAHEVTETVFTVESLREVLALVDALVRRVEQQPSVFR